MKRSLCIGANTGALKGCDNDALNWHSLFKNQLGFNEQSIILTTHAYKSHVLDEIRNLVREVNRERGLGVIVFSGHGKDVYDRQAIVCRDRDVYDDELREILDTLDTTGNDTHIVFISDSCHSGDLTNLGAAIKIKLAEYFGNYFDRSIFSLENIEELLDALLGKNLEIFCKAAQEAYEEEKSKEAGFSKYLFPDDVATYFKNRSKSGQNFLQPGKNDILISACDRTKSTYEALINCQRQGVFSYNAIEEIKPNLQNPQYTYEAWHSDILTELSRQQPEIQGNKVWLQKNVFSV